GCRKSASQSVIPIFRFSLQGERKSKGFDCVFTTGPSSGGTDYLKVLKVLDRVFSRHSVEFIRKKIDQTRFEFEVRVQLGIPSGWFSMAVLAPPSCFSISLGTSPMVDVPESEERSRPKSGSEEYAE
ncbi:hypothetical protein PIB30_078661, partial [Stylosanthes scabra]|nr:hypothetical protein [Stylosanthes scabra]